MENSNNNEYMVLFGDFIETVSYGETPKEAMVRGIKIVAELVGAVPCPDTVLKQKWEVVDNSGKTVLAIESKSIAQDLVKEAGFATMEWWVLLQ